MDSGDGDEGWPGRWDDREPDSGTDETTDSSANPGDETGVRDDGNVSGGDDPNTGDSAGEGPLARVRWFMNTDEEWVAFVREVLSSVAVVAIVGLLLFAISGLWPPMVAIESPSMEPHMERGDLVFLMEEHRFPGGAAYNGTGVVPYQAGAAADYKEFSEYGDVIVYQPDGSTQETPIIHRARFWVNDSENWYTKANEEYLGGADSCEELANCPAPHAGFVTKGDNNGLYDQVDTGAGPISSPVKSDWVTGTAELRIPWLGRIRLLFGTVGTGDLASPAGSVSAANAAAPGSAAGATSWQVNSAAVGV
ncbi:S26 family signal peptidase [Halococcus dombrowskii]|uniref:S26 family signal peptidase n=1 Tax=Halococcus dombrowskii TaxID=179637 RepID=A0AAV3SJU1_HALDO|nr:S26 family signal peptidase [Halococcus dombrowskii]UOO95524.1 S26 family signal peptidase [Halococcus dombrowskii]